MDEHIHTHMQDGSAHAHGDSTHTHPPTHSHNHVDGHTSRRDFLRVLGGAVAGASVMELAWYRAAWARAAAPVAGGDLFQIQKVSEGVFFAYARPQTIINCNAAIFVRSKDVVVVDAHSKPSAAAALINQIKREITPKPVRFVVNTHLHWDHTQGNHTYTAMGGKVDIIASATTKQMMAEQSIDRMKSSVNEAQKKLEALREQASRSKSAEEKAFCAEQIRQCEAFLAEMKDFTLELPTITFEKSYLLQDPAFDLHLDFHGHSHTAGDIFVFCPQARAVATGDASHGWLPNIADGYPRMWPKTIDEVKQADFKYVLGGHGPMQPNRIIMDCQRNYIEELAEKVAAGKQAGLSAAELQKRLTIANLRSLHSNDYAEFLARIDAEDNPHFGPRPSLQVAIDENVAHVYANLDKV